MVQDRKKQVQEVVRREIFARGVKEGGLKFLTYSPRDREDEPSPERRKRGSLQTAAESCPRAHDASLLHDDATERRAEGRVGVLT